MKLRLVMLVDTAFHLALSGVARTLSFRAVSIPEKIRLATDKALTLSWQPAALPALIFLSRREEFGIHTE
jgi:hypothetical protein